MECIGCGGGTNFASPEESALIAGMPHCAARAFLSAKRRGELAANLPGVIDAEVL